MAEKQKISGEIRIQNRIRQEESVPYILYTFNLYQSISRHLIVE